MMGDDHIQIEVRDSGPMVEPEAAPMVFDIETQVEGLSVLPAGKVPSNPSELLAGLRATLVMAELHQSFDVVIVDSPPLLVADPEIIGDLVDGLPVQISDGVRDVPCVAAWEDHEQQRDLLGFPPFPDRAGFGRYP